MSKKMKRLIEVTLEVIKVLLPWVIVLIEKLN